MIKIKEAIVVEGKYDKQNLMKIVDTCVLETTGFRIFKDLEKLNLIRKLAKDNGIVILTDSDSAGFIIRNYLKGAINEGTVKHAYIPDIIGKEKRKPKPSKEGKIGVEGAKEALILNALKTAGVQFLETRETTDKYIEDITMSTLYTLGLSGKEDSKAKRKALLKRLNLPEYISTKALLEILNATMSLCELEEICECIKLDK